MATAVPVAGAPQGSAPSGQGQPAPGAQTAPARDELVGQDDDGPGRAPSPARLQAVETLTPDSDIKPFMRAEVDPQTRSAALERLSCGLHFDRIDELDIHIEDYGEPDPIATAMLRTLEQARSLRLFDDEIEPARRLLPIRAVRRRSGRARRSGRSAHARNA